MFVLHMSNQVQRQIQEPLPGATPLLLYRAEGSAEKLTFTVPLWIFLVPSLNFQVLGWDPLRAVVWMWSESGIPENVQDLHLSKQPRHTQLENREQADLAVAVYTGWAEFGKGFISVIYKSWIPSVVSSKPLLFFSAWSEAVLSLPCTPSPLQFVSAFWDVTCFCSLPTDGRMLEPMGLQKRLSLGILLG